MLRLREPIERSLHPDRSCVSCHGSGLDSFGWPCPLRPCSLCDGAVVDGCCQRCGVERVVAPPIGEHVDAAAPIMNKLYGFDAR